MLANQPSGNYEFPVWGEILPQGTRQRLIEQDTQHLLWPQHTYNPPTPPHGPFCELLSVAIFTLKHFEAYVTGFCRGKTLIFYFSLKSDEPASGKTLSINMDPIHLYDFHRCRHGREIACLVGEFGKQCHCDLAWCSSGYSCFSVEN